MNTAVKKAPAKAGSVPDSSCKPISTGSEWTFELIEQYDQAIGHIAHDRYGLDTYRNQIEIIRSDQMLDAYTSVGMPIGYNHWSYGKEYVRNEAAYQRGHMGLAYEIVINSDPCIAYLMEENTMTMQALVIAHACYGHNSFFKGNYLFRSWTDAGAIIDYLVFARDYISGCEEKYGVAAVEDVLDSCHALMNYGVDRYKRPTPLSAEAIAERRREREAYRQQHLNDLWRTVPARDRVTEADAQCFPCEPEENLLYFIEKNAPLLDSWQRELIRIVRKMAQYFYPQRQTQVMNEGWATFWHYTLLNDLYDSGQVSDGFMMEFLQSHSGVLYQPGFDEPHYSGVNPYALGFAMMRDLRRVCEEPTEEDRHWFPDIAGSDWVETLHEAMRNYKDESFVLQFLSPQVIRDLKLFSAVDDDRESEIEISAIHDDSGYREIRQRLASQYNMGDREPDIQVQSVDVRGDRSMSLYHQRHKRRPLSDDTDEVLRHLHRLWGFDVQLQCFDGLVESQSFRCPPAKPAPRPDQAKTSAGGIILAT